MIKSVIVWDKQTLQLLEELKGRDNQVTAGHDGTVKMWDVRTDMCVSTVGRCSSAILWIECDDSTGILAAAGRDSYDIMIFKICISIRMVEDTLITGSDAVLACHAGRVQSVEYSTFDKGIINHRLKGSLFLAGSADGLLRFWENDGGEDLFINSNLTHFTTDGIKCVKIITLHNSSVLSINAGEHWLGIGAADNSVSLFHRPSNAGTKISGWQLYRVPQRTAAVV
ncbi:hypothetical protein F2Q69_00046514 [Brassica cretica]|uniref:Uncharacterized protein n=1 Tax=Brassica cretica TaxID=69181 RepID=A0A8S9PMP4_BRACR|nr:hypothetical protein F2Q69_00046514 [Brassica cretica]